MPYVFRLSEVEARRFMHLYKDQITPPKAAAMRALVKTDRATITLYHTGTLMVQGPNAEAVANTLAKTFSKPFNEPAAASMPAVDFYTPSIGSDESGVGDYFGPLVVCATYVSADDETYLKTLGVKDSKQLQDNEIAKLAEPLAKTLPYALLVLDNPTYNRLIEQGFNAHKLKAHLHAQCHKRLLEKLGHSALIIVDQFCTKSQYLDYVRDFDQAPIVDRFETKADGRYASVAAASIIARHLYVTKLIALGDSYQCVLEKGASDRVDRQAASLIKTHGIEILDRIAKKHFKTTQKALSIKTLNSESMGE